MSTSEVLQNVRDIPIRKYNYIDTHRRGTEITPGFIAQEVETVLPIAVTDYEEFIPNEFRTQLIIHLFNHLLT